MASTISAGTTLGTALQVTADTTGSLVLATNGGTTALTIDTSQNSTFTGLVNMKVYTVSTLPTAGTAGRRAFVNNALTPVALSAVVGGGALTVPVFDNGTTWIVG
jgi:hypothetical protein